jgi:hypothetical protein
MLDSTPPEPQPDEITLEEWIASTQSCCGVEPESRTKPQSTKLDCEGQKQGTHGPKMGK